MKNLKSIFTIGMSAFLSMPGYEKKPSPPNVIIIFPDQYRQFSLGLWSHGDNAKYIQGKPDPVNTPALDRLAGQGIVFSNMISNFPLSSPFRGMLMTGQYPTRNGIAANCHKDRTDGILSDGKSIANIFLDSGYETAYFGKCHWVRTEPLFDEKGDYQGTTTAPGGHYVNAYDTYVPPGESRLGFSYFFQTLRDTHYDPLCYSNDSKAIGGKKDGELYKPGRFSPELESEAILNYLDNTHGQRDTKKPFFITWSLNPPHNPWNEKNTNMSFFPQYTENGNVRIDKLLVRKNADPETGNYAPYYFANVTAVDFFIGKVLEKLKAMGVDENTIIVFASDHGEMLGSHSLTGKLKPEIEALNVPFIIKWGNKLQHRIENMILSVPDIMPTLLGLSGLGDKIPATVQGSDYSGIILNPSTADLQTPQGALYFNYNSRGLYTGDYTFVVTSSENGKLQEAYYYDNKKDPYQMTRITGDEMDSTLTLKLKSELAKRLKIIDDKWFREKICSEYLDY